MPMSYDWSFSTGLGTKILYVFLISPMRAACPTQLILEDFIILINFGESNQLLSSLCEAVSRVYARLAQVFLWNGYTTAR
jgi:hypothetical protein